MSEINGHEINHQFKDWKIVRLKDICSKIVDGSHNPPKAKASGKPMISAKDIYNNKISFDNPRWIDEVEFNQENKRTQIKAGDVLLTIVATIGRSAVVPKNVPDFTLQRSVAVIKTSQNPYYLSYAIQSPSFQVQLKKNAKGTAQKGVYLKTLSQLKVPLPSLEEQLRTVSKIEELFSELDKSIENLKTAQQQLKVYRQSVLKWAFEGRLTNEKVIGGKLPEGWHIKNLEDLGDKDYPFSYGVLKPGAYFPNGVLLIKSQHIRNLYISDSIDFRISKELDKEFKRTKIKGGEILLNLVGASIGRCAIAPEYLKGANVSRAVAVLTIDKLYSSRYILYFLANFFSEKKIKEITGGSAQPVLNLSTVRRIEVPLCPFKEQMRIVEEIESRLSVTDKVEDTIVNSLEQAEALRQSILKKAFEGKL